MVLLDTLIRNDFSLRFYLKGKGYKIIFTTPGGVRTNEYETYDEAKDNFRETAEENDMVSLGD